MIAAIRMAGEIGLSKKEKANLYNLRLRRKYSCVLIKDRGLLENVKTWICYGEIDQDTLKLLISTRARKSGNKPVSEGADSIIKKLGEGKTFSDLGIKPFFRLHPPKGGFKRSTKLLYPRGILGENKDINDLIRRML